MFSINYATLADIPFWFTIDHHIEESELLLKIRDRRCYVLRCNDVPFGIMRYNLFWDNTPFLNMIHFDEAYRRMGFGRMAMNHWEDEMREKGYKMVMTSTQADEDSQHFYRKLGYRDAGCLIIDIPPFEQPLEILLIKAI